MKSKYRIPPIVELILVSAFGVFIIPICTPFLLNFFDTLINNSVEVDKNLLESTTTIYSGYIGSTLTLISIWFIFRAFKLQRKENIERNKEVELNRVLDLMYKQIELSSNISVINFDKDVVYSISNHDTIQKIMSNRHIIRLKHIKSELSFYDWLINTYNFDERDRGFLIDIINKNILSIYYGYLEIIIKKIKESDKSRRNDLCKANVLDRLITVNSFGINFGGQASKEDKIEIMMDRFGENINKQIDNEISAWENTEKLAIEIEVLLKTFKGL